jgi:hypothetical protein
MKKLYLTVSFYRAKSISVSNIAITYDLIFIDLNIRENQVNCITVLQVMYMCYIYKLKKKMHILDGITASVPPLI